jgi:uncharacterized protein YjbI with pentapeptide repeats
MATIRQALTLRNLNREQVVMLIRAGATLAGAVLVLIIVVLLLGLVAGFNFISENATLTAALLALTGVLIAQVVNTYIARVGQRNQQELASAGQRNQQELEDRRTRAASLQSYLEQMGRLLTEHRLGVSNQNDNADYARVVAQAQTLAVLEGMGSDSIRKRIVLLFLYRAALIDKNGPAVDLGLANLSGAMLSRAGLFAANLRWADLSSAYLSSANLDEADLHGAYLEEADLSGTDLEGADLSGAYLIRSDLSDAHLSGADLSGADLSNANLHGANLHGANLEGAQGVDTEQLEQQAYSLSYATMPDGSIHD